jgi:hypothetical protein
MKDTEQRFSGGMWKSQETMNASAADLSIK